MITPKRKKQFIAGAVCPKCSDVDSLILYPESQTIECVSCGFKQNPSQRDESSKVESAAKTHAKIGSNQAIKITNLSD